jgi:ATP-dependent Clp endopeptidase proteolytic subunit ClpP
MRKYFGVRNNETTEDTEEETSSSTIKTINNSIYFYADVNDDNVLELITQLKELETKLLKLSIEYPEFNPKITIHIKSDGGDIFAGFSAFDHIKTSRVPIVTVVDGCCASAATFILMGGSERYMGSSAYVLIHQLSSGMLGKYHEMKDEIQSFDKFMDSLKKIYVERTSIPDKKLKAMMKKDIYLTSDDCIRYGIVDDLFSQKYPCTS